MASCGTVLVDRKKTRGRGKAEEDSKESLPDLEYSRMQTSTARTSFLNAITTVINQNGLSTCCSILYRNMLKSYHPGPRGLYTGLTASIFRQMTYSVTRLGAYDAMKNTMSRQGTS